jgi:hypothetical protein
MTSLTIYPSHYILCRFQAKGGDFFSWITFKQAPAFADGCCAYGGRRWLLFFIIIFFVLILLRGKGGGRGGGGGGVM